MKTKRLVIDIPQETFDILEIIAYSNVIANYPDETDKDLQLEKLEIGLNKKNNDFGNLVNSLIKEILFNIDTGVKRPGSWENGSTSSITNWDGNIYPNMIVNEKLKEELKEVYKND